MSPTAAIEQATVNRDPFPYMLVDNVLPERLMHAAVRHWPADRMMQEPGGLNRRWAYLISKDAINPAMSCGLFWLYFTLRYGRPILRSVFKKFKADCEAKNGARDIEIAQLVCFDAESDFIEHPPHAHWDIGPEWLFTVLIYLDDNGRDDRGTRLYRRQPDSTFSTALDTGFVPGRMLAFFESPDAYHGSTPFDGGADGRKIFRAHVLARG